MASRFNPPPGWPTPPVGWTPPAGWEPDPAWPPAPSGWEYWVQDGDTQSRPGTIPPPPAGAPPGSGASPGKRRDSRILALVSAVAGVAALVVGWLAWVNPDPANQVSSMEERQPYIAQVESLCAEAVSRFGEVPQSDELDPQVYEQGSLILGDVLQRWAGLDPPREADNKLIMPILDSLESMVLSLEEVAEWVRLQAPEQAGAEFERLREHNADFRRHARQYGLTGCPTQLSVD